MKWTSPKRLLSVCFPLLSVIAYGAEPKQNLVVIIVDDLNDYVGCYGGHPQTVTPNLDSLSKDGTLFVNAACNSPICGPSRASLLTGVAPWRSGFLGYKAKAMGGFRKNAVLKEAETMMAFLHRNGYGIFTSGKIYHQGHEDDMPFVLGDKVDGVSRIPKADYGPMPLPVNGDKAGWKQGHDKHLGPKGGAEMSYARFSEIPGKPQYKGWGHFNTVKPWNHVDADGEDLAPDEAVAAYGAAVAKMKHDKPFALFLGFHRPHSPLYASDAAYDRIPFKDLKLAPTPKGNDLKDIASVFKPGNPKFSTGGFLYSKYKKINVSHKGDGLRHYTRAYLACVSFVDEQIGKAVKAIREAPGGKNTTIILTSDHGYHVGEKQAYFKNSPWERSVRVPFLVVGPKVPAGKRIDQPVSLLDIYPTVLDLAGIKEGPKQGLDGHSIVPLLRGKSWKGPDYSLCVVASTGTIEIKNIPTDILKHHLSLRTVRYRYIRANNGEEELYDHENDPNEWHNRVKDPQYAEALVACRKRLTLALPK